MNLQPTRYETVHEVSRENGITTVARMVAALRKIADELERAQ